MKPEYTFLNVWLIDDGFAFPLSTFGDMGQKILELGLPIRCDYLDKIINSVNEKEWDERNLKELVRYLLNNPCITVTAFIHPDVAISFLDSGSPPPDMVIFDWEYLIGTDSQHTEWISNIIERGYTFLTIYTHKPIDGIEETIKELKVELGSQLLGVFSKGTDYDTLIKKFTDQTSGSLASEVLPTIRNVCNEALGRALRQFARIDKALLASIEGSAIETQELLAQSLEQEVRACGEHADVTCVSGNGSRFVSEGIRASPELTKELSGIIQSAAGREGTQQTISPNAIRQFQSYQLYQRHRTNRVIRGDVVIFDPDTTVIVITAPCHLAKFGQKTRNIITYLRIYPCDVSGWEKIASGQPLQPFTASKSNVKQKYSICDSWQIGSDGIFMLPSIPVSSNDYLDYFCIPYKVESLKLDSICGCNNQPLTYEHLIRQFPQLRRLATISENYLNPFLWAISQSIFNPGARDYLKEECDRLYQYTISNFRS